MKKNILAFGILLLVTLMAFTSCRKKQHLEVSKGLLVFSFAGGTDLFSIEADCDWTIETDASQQWLTVSPLTGSGDANIVVTVSQNNDYDRNTSFTVTSSNGKIRREIAVAQSKIDINAIANKVWFLRLYERWDSDYYDVVIPESYRNWIYYSNPGEENWFFYFLVDSTGYEIRTHQGDTVFYAYDYVYYPLDDSLNITFRTIDDTIEDYHTVIHALTDELLSFSDAYRPHQFEKLTMYDVTGDSRSLFGIKPKNVGIKPKGALITLP